MNPMAGGVHHQAQGERNTTQRKLQHGNTAEESLPSLSAILAVALDLVINYTPPDNGIHSCLPYLSHPMFADNEFHTACSVGLPRIPTTYTRARGVAAGSCDGNGVDSIP